MDNRLPHGAVAETYGGDTWTWNAAWPSANVFHESDSYNGHHQHHFENASETLVIHPGDTLTAWIYIDPIDLSREVMLQWHVSSPTYGSLWEFRAYWGENDLPFGSDNTTARRYMGPLPAVAPWVELSVPAAAVGLAVEGLESVTVDGMAFTLNKGKAAWDRAGKINASGLETTWFDDRLPYGAVEGTLHDAWTFTSGPSIRDRFIRPGQVFISAPGASNEDQKPLVGAGDVGVDNRSRAGIYNLAAVPNGIRNAC